jgi:hypothetical protein
LDTLGHILGQCTYTKEQKYIRHDGTKHLLRKKLTDDENEAVAKRRPGIPSPDGKVLKPDLVIKNWKRGLYDRYIKVLRENGNYIERGDSVISKDTLPQPIVWKP